MHVSVVGIITHPKVAATRVKNTVELLEGKGISLYLDPVAAKKIGKRGKKVESMEVDISIVFGGDGTILWAINKLKKGTPVLGIKTGRIGYLAEINKDEAKEGITSLIRGKFWIDERMKLSVNEKFEALNEIAIYPDNPGKLLDFKVELDKEELTSFRADALLISTQTGSTGHALSAGGPIIHPGAEVYSLVPIAPFMREHPPIVIPSKSKLVIELLRKGRNAQLLLDGKSVKRLKPGEKIRVRKSKNPARFIRLKRG